MHARCFRSFPYVQQAINQIFLFIFQFISSSFWEKKCFYISSPRCMKSSWKIHQKSAAKGTRGVKRMCWFIRRSDIWRKSFASRKVRRKVVKKFLKSMDSAMQTRNSIIVCHLEFLLLFLSLLRRIFIFRPPEHHFSFSLRTHIDEREEKSFSAFWGEILVERLFP